jgi:hypothetical protein
VASNATPEGRSENRRVDIVVLPHITPPVKLPAMEQTKMERDGSALSSNLALAH